MIVTRARIGLSMVAPSSIRWLPGRLMVTRLPGSRRRGWTSRRPAPGRPLLDGHAEAPRHGVDELGGGFFEQRFWSLNAWP
jgi:hypothetical protein